MKNPVTDFLLWAAKTDCRLLRLCTPFTQKTHVARGYFVLLTSLFSLGSCYYTVSTIASSSPMVAVPLSLLWASMIFMIDRELVGNWSRRSLWLRVALATILGLIIAIPAEIRVMEGRIDQQIARTYNKENGDAIARLQQRQRDADQHEADLRQQLAGLRGEVEETGRNLEAEIVGRMIAHQTTGLAGKGPAYEAASQRLDILDTQIKNVYDELNQVQDDRARIIADFKRQEIAPVHDFPTRYEALESATPWFSPMWKLSWFITLAFILVDMMPVLMKAFSPVTDYDRLLAAQVRENIERVRVVADSNAQVMDKGFLTPRPSTVELFEKLFAPEESKIYG
jgi:hypothetical protein